MSALFPLPDVAEIWNNNDDTLLFSDVPCRQVPRLFNYLEGINTATNTDFYAISHWVDLNPIEDLTVDGYSTVGAGQVRFEFDAGYILYVATGIYLLKLRVIYIEPRYTGLPKEYLRLYCQRMGLI